MNDFTFEVSRHYNNLDIQVKISCDEPFCPFQNTKLCKRNILKSVLQRRSVTISEMKLSHGEYLVQFYLSKKMFNNLKKMFKNIDSHIKQVRNPKSNLKNDNTIELRKSIKIDPIKSKPKKKWFKSKEVIFTWIMKNYKSECRLSNIEGQYFLVNNENVVGYIVLDKKEGMYSVKELNLVDANLNL